MTGATSTGAGAAGPPARPGRNLAGILLGGAAGAGLVLLAARQELARVVVHAPRPLPDSVTTVNAQDLRPAIAALAVAAMASLAAVLATRGWLRRLTGVVAIGLGAGVAVTALGPVTARAVLAAAGRSGASPATGGGAGTAAGSVTAGNGGAGASGPIAGGPAHVLLGGTGWQVLMIAGAALIVAAGVAIVVLAGRLPVMSARFERRGGARAVQAPGDGPPAPPWAVQARGDDPPAPPAVLSMWESLSAGGDPTMTGPD